MRTTVRPSSNLFVSFGPLGLLLMSPLLIVVVLLSFAYYASRTVVLAVVGAVRSIARAIDTVRSWTGE